MLNLNQKIIRWSIAGETEAAVSENLKFEGT